MPTLLPAIGPADTTKRAANGYFYHPVFFSEENKYNGTVDSWLDLLAHYELETLQIVAADNGFTGLTEGQKEQLMKGHNVARHWTPPYPTGHGTGWFLLIISEQEDCGLYAIYARQGQHDETVVGDAQ